MNGLLPEPGPFSIVYRDQDFVVIDKPSGYHVHQPEPPRRRVPSEITVLYQLRRQIDQWLYPIHRLDVATSGLLVIALNKEVASMMGKLFTNGEVRKQYRAIVRGYMPEEGKIDMQLELDSTEMLVDAVTDFKTLARVELPNPVGKRHASARYSLLDVRPQTGRWHQIRRHVGRLAHPVVGDTVHGDSHHNRFFREELKLPGLWLRATGMEFEDPRDGKTMRFEAPESPAWQRACERLGFSNHSGISIIS